MEKCYDNARIESFFATLKKEKLYRIDTTKLKREEVKKPVYQNRQLKLHFGEFRVCTIIDFFNLPYIENFFFIWLKISAMRSSSAWASGSWY